MKLHPCRWFVEDASVSMHLSEQQLGRRAAAKRFSVVFFVWVLLSTALVILVVPAGLLGVFLFREKKLA
ncbi:hypothetical protein MTO96_000147 [Rhipicephalus appendiculatus]